MKQIITDIKNCRNCPFIGHTGQFTSKGGAKPCCDHPKIIKQKGNNCFKRIIPTRKEADKNICRFVRKIKKIPKWCPLPDRPKKDPLESELIFQRNDERNNDASEVDLY